MIEYVARMNRKQITFLALASALLLVLAAFLAGCGKDESSTSYDCDLEAPSLIPPPTGRPEYVYFFRDT